jgi:colanic acid biosynthesis glycosyl transferase WcaI
MTPPTFLIISQVYPPDPTSVGQHMHDAAKGLVQRGLRVRVLTSARGYDNPSIKYPSRETMDGVDVIRLPLSSLGKKTMAHRLVAQSMFLLQAVVRGIFTPGLVGILVSTSPPMASVSALIIRIFRRAKVKFWVMDLNPDQLIEMGKITEQSLPARAFNALNRAILRVSDDVVALDRFMADRLNKKRDVRDKMTVLPPWPHSEHMESIPHESNPFRKQHGLDGKFVVMYSGNHGATTPVQTVLDAAVKMQDREDLVFMFIGGGVGKRDVERTMTEHPTARIINLPYQPFDQLQYSLSAADVHLVTMGNDVVGVIHPCKVYGAMALARPILLVGPPECHVSDIMRERNIGIHIQHGDVDGAIAAIERLKDMTPAERKAMGDAAAELVNERFQQSKMIETFCDIMTHDLPIAGNKSA